MPNKLDPIQLTDEIILPRKWVKPSSRHKSDHCLIIVIYGIKTLVFNAVTQNLKIVLIININYSFLRISGISLVYLKIIRGQILSLFLYQYGLLLCKKQLTVLLLKENQFFNSTKVSLFLLNYLCLISYALHVIKHPISTNNCRYMTQYNGH